MLPFPPATSALDSHRRAKGQVRAEKGNHAQLRDIDTANGGKFYRIRSAFGRLSMVNIDVVH
jgi:hypothetical protein